MQKSMLLVLVLSLTTTHSIASESVKDNSFLIEEAYNQEAGVVQFINAWQYSELSKDWAYTFTNELPAPNESHQLSYSLPLVKQTGQNGEADETGLGDISLNYRHQLFSNEVLTLTPRVSILLPTGDHKKGQGYGAVGMQFNQTLSLAINDKWTNHWNAGFTFIPNAKDTAENTAHLTGLNFGTSAIYNVTPKTNLLVEFVMNTMEAVTGPDSKTTETSYFVVPGIRTAFDVGDETEVVPGLGVLLGTGPSAVDHETGIFAYLSIESKLW